jgi:hypothetical protein
VVNDPLNSTFRQTVPGGLSARNSAHACLTCGVGCLGVLYESTSVATRPVDGVAMRHPGANLNRHARRAFVLGKESNLNGL